MDRASWLKLFDRWLKPVVHNGNAGAVPGRRLPCDAVILVPLSHCPSSASKLPEILVAVAPDDSQHERVHSGHYLIPEVEACVLCGEDGAFLIPWPNITWIRA